jgi:flagellar hook-associated protein 2
LNTGSNSALQVSGLASGIDVDSIVNKLMAAESVPLDTMNQKLQLLEWKRDDYRTMSTQLSTLLDSVNTMTLQSSYTKAATVSDSTKVTVTPASGAGNANFTITNATLATVATNYSQESNGIATSIATSSFDSSKALIDQTANLKNGITWDSNTISDETHSVTADGATFYLNNGAVTANAITVDDGTTATDYSIFTSQDDYNNSTDLNKVLVNTTTGKLNFNNTIAKGSTITASYDYKTVNVDLTTYNSSGQAVPIQFDANGSMSLDSILQKINSYGTVNSFFDSASQQVAISTSNTGNNNSSGQEMQFNSSFFTNTLKLNSAYEQGGNDAAFTINGMSTTRHSNTFTISNTTFTLNDAIPSSQTVTVGIATDTDGMYDKIKSFVDTYNDTISKINDMIGTPTDRDYQPLTSVQKAQMSDTDITNWNEKARQGTLYNDNILTNALSTMRQNIYNVVGGITGGSYSQLAQIGITTSSDYTEHGKLEIDESKLKAAISADPNGVMKLFTSGSTSDSSTSTQGIAKRLYTTINNTISQIKTQAGTVSLANNQFYIGKSINELNTQITTFQDHLKTIQTRYYSQFTAMEEAIQQANSQASYLQSTFS